MGTIEPIFWIVMEDDVELERLEHIVVVGDVVSKEEDEAAAIDEG